jgi:hypothetical protein
MTELEPQLADYLRRGAAMTQLHPQLADYIRRGWLIVPCAWGEGERKPLIEGGFRAASRDPLLVASWWRRWPLALVAVATGSRPGGSGIVVIDIDLKSGGFRTLARLVGLQIPAVPRVTTPSGGLHLQYLAPPGGCISTDGIGGKRRRGLGPGVDVKANLRMCHFPGPSPVSRYFWDLKFNLETCPLLPLPAELTPVEVADEELPAPVSTNLPIGRPGAYAEAALKAACKRIREAAFGTQRNTLNAESYAIGRLAAGMGLDHAEVTSDLIEAGMAMGAQAGRDPWRLHQVRKTVVEGFRDGLRKPSVPNLRSRRGER